MVKTERIGIYYEHNRDGKLHKIETYKDKDKEDTTLTFWVKLPDGSLNKAGEYIVKDDQSLPPQCPDKQHWDEAAQKCVDDPPVENKPPKIEAPSLVNARIGSPTAINITVTDPDGDPFGIVWRQTLPEPKDLPEFDNNQVATITFDVEGDYLIQVSATDDKGHASDALINVKARDSQVPPPSDFQTVVSHTADNDDTKEGVKSMNMAGKAPAVAFGGDGPYDENNPQGFIDEWQKNISKEHTIIAERGNHDALEDGNQKTKDALDKYFGWPKDGPANQATKVNNVAFVGIDTQDDKIGDKNGAQYKFVAGALETFSKDPDVDFIIVVMHKPLYSHGYKHGDEKSLRLTYHELFAKYDVAICYESHNHNFWHTYPISLVNGVITKVYTEIPNPEAGSPDIIYDFSQDHGVLFWGDGAGGHDLYKIDEGNLPDFIRDTNDKDFGISEIAVDKNNPKNLRIRNVSQAGKVLHSVIIRKGEQGPPQKRPPIINGPETIKIEPNKGLDIGLQVMDSDGGTIKSISWQFSPPDKVVTPVFMPEGGPYNRVIFTTPDSEGDIIAMVTATDNDDLVTGKSITIQVRKEVVTPEEGTLIYDSLEHWKPADGKDHKIVEEVGDRNHKDASGDPDGWGFPMDALSYASNAHSASQDPDFAIVRADGSLDIRENQHRTYHEIKNYNVRDVTTFVWSDECDNLSKKKRNKHQLGADGKTKGIAGMGDHIGKNRRGAKREDVHGTNTELLKDGSLPKSLEDGKTYVWETWLFDEIAPKEKPTDPDRIWVHGLQYLDYGDGKGLIKIADYYDKKPLDCEIKPELYVGPNGKSAIWNRYNGPEEPKDYIKIKRMQIYDLGNEPRRPSS